MTLAVIGAFLLGFIFGFVVSALFVFSEEGSVE
ncbi:MAG: hypothetical protein KatS3mg023_3930 [Armatimonadota bacterium]|nr:MAG: hypothetical protein KatS3mg023_3930 [Armatimonadota bacterium]